MRDSLGPATSRHGLLLFLPPPMQLLVGGGREERKRTFVLVTFLDYVMWLRGKEASLQASKYTLLWLEPLEKLHCRSCQT